MNGELMNLIQLTLAAQNYIKKGEDSEQLATDKKKIGKITFKFTEQSFGSKAPALETDDRGEWLKELAARGANDFKLLVIDEIENLDQLGLLNGIPCCMLCFYDGGVTAWNKKWSFNAETKLFEVELVESVCENTPSEKPVFKDVTQPMVTLLMRIRALAQKLGLSAFSDDFSKAIEALQADFVGGVTMKPANYRLLNAAINAYVFGAAGSWNHIGKNIAAQRNMSEEFEELSKELYRGIALSCMYAVNEM